MTDDELTQMAQDLLWQIQYGLTSSRLDHILAALQLVQRAQRVADAVILKKAKVFIEYARYELQPGKAVFADQFPKQADADAVIAAITAALPGVEEDTHDRG